MMEWSGANDPAAFNRADVVFDDSRKRWKIAVESQPPARNLKPPASTKLAIAAITMAELAMLEWAT